MTISPSAMMEGIVTLLSAASVYGTGMVTKGTYDILETTAGSCAVVSPTGLASVNDAFGQAQRMRKTDFLIENLFRDTGDGISFTAAAVRGMHTVMSCLESSDDLAGAISSCTAEVGDLEGKLAPGKVYEVGGGTIRWIPFPVTLSVVELI